MRSSFETALRRFGHTSLPVVLLMSLAQPGCMQMYDNSRRASHAGATDGWHEVSPAGMGFRVFMPHRPHVETDTGRANDGAATRSVRGTIRWKDQAVLSFVVTEVEHGHLGAAQGNVDAMTRRFVAELDHFDVVSSEDVTHAGLVGVEVRSRDVEEGLELFTRHFVGRSRTYTLVAAIRKGQTERFEPLVRRYFDSLQVVDADTVVPSGGGEYQTANWVYMTPARDDFSVQLPGRPELTDSTLEVDGQTARGRTFRTTSADSTVSYSVRIHRFVRQRMPTGLFELMIAQQAGAGSTVRAQSDTQRQGYAGMAVIYDNPDSVQHTLYFRTMSRIYEFSVRVPRGREDEQQSARDTFFSSIRIH